MSVDDPAYNHAKPMATGAPPRDYSDSPLKGRRDLSDTAEQELKSMRQQAEIDRQRYNELVLEQREHEAHGLNNAAFMFDEGIKLMTKALQALPNTRPRNVAVTNFETAIMWAQRAFNEAGKDNDDR